jgi:hypothetical protein
MVTTRAVYEKVAAAACVKARLEFVKLVFAHVPSERATVIINGVAFLPAMPILTTACAVCEIFAALEVAAGVCARAHSSMDTQMDPCVIGRFTLNSD